MFHSSREVKTFRNLLFHTEVKGVVIAYVTSVAGTAITASWANASVRDQGVSQFASSAARDVAISSPVAGMVAYIGAGWSTYDGTRWCGEWIAVTFTNSWVDFGAANQVCQYRKLLDMVQLRGLMKTGTLNTAAFTLPAGFRPSATILFATFSNAAYGSLQIDNAGVVNPVNGSNVSFAVNCIFSTL